jgi:hypothetical protein
MSRSAPVVVGHLDSDGNGDLMCRPVNAESPMNGNRCCARGCNFSLHVICTERNLRIAVALQDFPVHLSVARIVSAATTNCINHYVSTHGAVLAIEIDGAPIEVELSMNGVNYVTQCKIHRRFGRVERQNEFVVLAIRTGGDGEQNHRPRPEPTLANSFQIENHPHGARFRSYYRSTQSTSPSFMGAGSFQCCFDKTQTAHPR